MATLNLQYSFRPLKFGWCLRKDDFKGMRKAIALSSTLWGGRYNPLIIVDEEDSGRIIDEYRVDALYQVSEDNKTKEFIDKYKHLPWPNVHKDIYLSDSEKIYSNYVDLFHPINLLYKEQINNINDPKININLIEWDTNDPLSDILLATVGKITSPDIIPKDFLTMIKSMLPFTLCKVKQNEPIRSDLFKINTINSLTTYGLIEKWKNSKLFPYGFFDKWKNLNSSGFYYGDSKSFTDIVNYWNLRACNIEVLFYDKNYSERLDLLRNEYIEVLEKNLEKRQKTQISKFFDGIYIWKGFNVKDKMQDIFKTEIIIENIYPYNTASESTIIPPSLNSERKTAFGLIDEKSNKLTANFQYDNSLFNDEGYEFTQYMILSLNILNDIDFEQIKDYTFFIPNLPELNEFLARKCFHDYSRLRINSEGINLIVSVINDTITLNALKKGELFSEIFDTYSFNTEIPIPSLKVSRAIKQMGGIQDCRVFMIKGVRNLLNNENPNAMFPTSKAEKTIGQMEDNSNKINFEDFEDLYIERREKRKLMPLDVLKYLTEKNVFRVGLNLECPNCKLKSWIHIDNLKTISVCSYCGYEFNITRQLKNRDWFYRPSGLFSTNDTQFGIIPVILTLRLLDTTISSSFKIFSTGLKIESKTQSSFKCEIDFIYLSQWFYTKPQMAIAECKTKDKITEDDVLHLKKIADSLPANRIDVFIIFSKLIAFSEEEVKLCQKAQDQFRFRVIMLTENELERYHIYEKKKKELDIKIIAVSLDDLAKITHEIYFKKE